MQTYEYFSTASIDPAKQLHHWNAIANQSIPGVAVESFNPGFPAEIWWCNLGRLHMARPRTPAGRVVRRPFSSDPDMVVLHLQLRGSSSFHQGKISCQLVPGDMNINFPGEGYNAELGEGNELLCVEFSLKEFDGALPCWIDRSFSKIHSNSPGSLLLSNYLLSLWQSVGFIDEGSLWLEEAVQAFFILISASAKGERAKKSIEKPFIEKIQEVTSKRLSDPLFNAAILAKEVGVSIRSIQIAFSKHSLTPSEYISSKRLELGAALIRKDRSRTITDIALSVGFNDSAYFTRCFRKKYGISPSEWRIG